jgi:hypothetical protein
VTFSVGRFRLVTKPVSVGSEPLMKTIGKHRVCPVMAAAAPPMRVLVRNRSLVRIAPLLRADIVFGKDSGGAVVAIGRDVPGVPCMETRSQERLMPRFYFHVRSEGYLATDEHGCLCNNILIGKLKRRHARPKGSQNRFCLEV